MKLQPLTEAIGIDAAVSRRGARVMAASLACDCVLECLGQATPGRASATSSDGTNMPFIWAPRTTPGEEPRILIDNSLTGGGFGPVNKQHRPNKRADTNARDN